MIRRACSLGCHYILVALDFLDFSTYQPAQCALAEALSTAKLVFSRLGVTTLQPSDPCNLAADGISWVRMGGDPVKTWRDMPPGCLSSEVGLKFDSASYDLDGAERRRLDGWFLSEKTVH
jgi:hypothetical protein